MAGLALPAIVTRTVEVVDQVVAVAAAVAGIRKAVVGIWGRGRRSTGGHWHSGRASRGQRHWSWVGKDAGSGARTRPGVPWEPRCVACRPGAADRGGRRGAWQADSLVSQSSPSQPLGQKQRNESTPSMHVPPFRHGWPRQSSMSAGRRREQGLGLVGPTRPPGQWLLTLMAIGAREAAVADAREIAPGLTDAVSVGATRARGGHTGRSGSCLKPTAVDHCSKWEVSPPACGPASPAPPSHLCWPSPTSAGPARARLPGHRAVLAPHAVRARAVVVTLQVVAASTVLAGTWLTEVDVHLSDREREAPPLLVVLTGQPGVVST